MVAREQSGVLRYFLQDRLSTRLITDGSGNLVGREDHLPFGEDSGTGSGESEKHRFTSYERDSESNTDYAMNRQYATTTGRFLQPDPAAGSISNPQSLNRYAYVGSDPINSVDPYGLFPIIILPPINLGQIGEITVTAQPDPIIPIGIGLFQFGPGEFINVSIDPSTVTQPQNPGPTQAQTNARNLLDDCRIYALLNTLAYSEGADYDTVVMGTVIKAPGHPELVGKTNVTVPDFSEHPNILVQVSPGLNSTAAGRYQFLKGTWTGLGLPDFSPLNQDVGAVMLMRRRGMITPLLNGDVEQAIMNGNAEWASLPGSPYGQGTRSMNALKKVYNQSFFNCVFAKHEIHQGPRDNNGA